MKKLLIVEGNLKEENESFSKVGIQTHTESLKDSLNYFTKDLKFDVVNPSSDRNMEDIVASMSATITPRGGDSRERKLLFCGHRPP